MIFPRRPYLRYTVVAAMTACVLAANFLLAQFVAPGYLAFFLAVVLLGAWSWGRSAGLGLMSRQWEATLSSIAEGVVIVDRKGCVRFLNPSAEAMTGWPVREASGKTLEEIVKLAEEKTNGPKILSSRDGHEVWVEESSAPMRNEGGVVVGRILLFRDVTMRRKVQDQVNQSQRMDAVGRLASAVAGDFNDLLTVMTGYSEMLRTDLDPEDHRQRFADEIYTAADRAAGLTRQLTALSSSQPGVRKVLDLSALIGSMETMLHRVLGNQIDLVIIPGAGRVRADASQLEQVMVNLAMNSRDAMPNGGKFVIELGNLEMDAKQADQWPGVKPGSYVTMTVSDTGTGMDAETRSHLFEPFFTTKAKEKGTGLGLSIVYGIIQQSRGCINVYSQLGAGTIFEIFLPRDRGTAEIVLPAPQRRNKRGKETVLVADDEEGVRKLVHAVLATNGYKVLEACDGAEALTLYKAYRGKINIVVTDVSMPNMSGFELGAQVREMDPALSILYMSGRPENEASGTEGEVYHRPFLYKPFTPDGLLTQVRQLLDARASDSSQFS